MHINLHLMIEKVLNILRFDLSSSYYFIIFIAESARMCWY